MHFRKITSGALAMLLLSGTAAMTRDAHLGTLGHLGTAHEAQPIGVQRVGLFGLFHKSDTEAPVTLAQSADPRVTQLEEEIRKLSGTVEELNFQILQMQEQLRKMQEDNEFRFQELEKGSTAGAGSNKKSEASPARDNTVPGPGQPGSRETTAATVAPRDNGAAESGRGAPPADLGTITVDKDGNVDNSSVGQPADLLHGSGNPSDNTTVAALPSTDDPDELYRNSYEFILSGDYLTAEAGFRQHISRFPADPKAPDAHYWLGEALLGQQKYRDAAEVFLGASKEYPDAGKAPDMLLKLGVSLKALKQHDVACATFKEVNKRYPRASDALKQRVKQEQALAAC
jgi:tol-pal system protein YbgF